MKIGVIGLGYVGLPLAVSFSEKYRVIGFDINKERVLTISEGLDATGEVNESHLRNALKRYSNTTDTGLFCSNLSSVLVSCDIFIITVPTPTDKHKRPDLTPLIKASETVGEYLSVNGIVIYESTVYPGVTEEICVPILEDSSRLKFNKDFFVGYSPERINPGDKERGFTNIVKVTSGSTEEIRRVVDDLYKSVVAAGTYSAPSIKVAEASKVIENSQRDINIAFVNELSKIFDVLDIDTNEVLKAARTKWNFLPFSPGLVGGHCIGVDPYYLAQKAQDMGYYPELILAGRRINDSMGSFVIAKIVKQMAIRDIPIRASKALILGFTFKENCPDYRNTRVHDIYLELKDYGMEVDIYDPWVNKDAVLIEYDLEVFTKKEALNKYSVIILAVSHYEFNTLDINELRNSKSLVFDIKGFLPDNLTDCKL
jgi:UDP-N-acetyl-D-galactosamine dehydrogenase